MAPVRKAPIKSGWPQYPNLLPKHAHAEAWSQKSHFHRPLPTQFRHDGFDYRQIAREDDAAIYEQTWAGCSNPSVRYEVIRIRRRDGFHIDGRFVEPAETYPNSEAWGVDGFTLNDKEAAFARLREIKSMILPFRRAETDRRDRKSIGKCLHGKEE